MLAGEPSDMESNTFTLTMYGCFFFQRPRGDLGLGEGRGGGGGGGGGGIFHDMAIKVTQSKVLTISN